MTIQYGIDVELAGYLEKLPLAASLSAAPFRTALSNTLSSNLTEARGVITCCIVLWRSGQEQARQWQQSQRSGSGSHV